MGILSWFSRKRKKKQDSGEEFEQFLDGKRLNRKTDFANNTEAQIAYIRENCELILQSSRKLEDTKIEYQAVTSYLTDIQRIEDIHDEDRALVEKSARKILELTKEREKYKKKDTKITDQQYKLFELHELQIPKELTSIKDAEKFKILIENDRKHLEKEKKNLVQEKEESINKQVFLKWIAILTCIIVAVLFVIFLLINQSTEADLTLPFLLTILMGIASTFYIFIEAKKNTRDVKFIEMKMKKEITLMNKLNIKEVNNRNYLEYTYNKYMVNSYNEMLELWNEYIKLKEEAKRYQKNSELLEVYQSALIEDLEKYGVVDAEIWIYQPSAIVDKNEMVEVRHRLNVRRQKLRELIDTNMKQKEDALNLIHKTMIQNPDCQEEASKLLEQYHID